MARAARELTVAFAFLVLSIVMTWPLAKFPSLAVLGPADPYVSAYVLDWDYYATFHHPSKLFHPPEFYPAKYALAFSEHLYGIAIWTFPFFLFGASPVTAHTAGIILGFAFCGYGAYVLGRLITESTIAGFVAGLFFAFMPYRFHHIPHISYVWMGWIPLLFAALIHYARRPTMRNAVLFGAAFFMNGLTCMHWFAFGSFAAALAAVLFWRGTWRQFARLAAAAAIATTLLLPFLLPYRSSKELYGLRRSYEETLGFSATWRDWLTPPRENRLYGSLTPPEAYEAEHPLFPGFVALLVAAYAVLTLPTPAKAGAPHRATVIIAAAIFGVIAIVVVAHGRFMHARSASDFVMLAVVCLLIPIATDRQEKTAAHYAILFIAIGFIGSLGLHAFFHRFLFDHVAPFQSIRVAARWSTIAYVGLTMLIAIGVAALNRRWLAIAIGIALLIECNAAPIVWYLKVPGEPQVYRWLAKVPIRGAVLELPLRHIYSDYEALLGATIHHKPLINGVSSFEPPGYGEIINAIHQDPLPDDLLDRLEQRGCSLIVVHVDRLYGRRPAFRAWLKEELGRGRLTFVRRFDHEIWGDYVFAVTRNEPAMRSNAADTATLQAFLERDPFTYNHSTFAMLSEPAWNQDARGNLNVSGWAMSPNGIAAVDVLIDDHRVRIPAQLYPAPWISSAMPWYPVPKPLFMASIPRPKRLRDTTDVQIEITDGKGNRTRLDDLMLRWPNKPGLKAQDWNAEALRPMLARISNDPQITDSLMQRRVTAGDLSDMIVEHSKGMTNAEFVDEAFRILFDHASVDAPMWREKLARGAWRRDVTDALIKSPEFARLYLKPGVKMEPLR